MPKPLNHVELGKAADDVMHALSLCQYPLQDEGRGVVVAGLVAITKLAFEQAASPPNWVIGDPPIDVRNACAALEAPKDSADG